MLFWSLCLTEKTWKMTCFLTGIISLSINPYMWAAVRHVLISVCPRSWWRVWARSLKAADSTLAFGVLLFLLLFTWRQLLAGSVSLSDLCLTLSSPFFHHVLDILSSHPCTDLFFSPLLSTSSDRRETERGEDTVETPVLQPQSDNSSAAV